MPRFRPDGSVNALHFQRLKDKLGNRSNASSEVEFEQAFATGIGGEGEGIRTILKMVQLTRIDCAIASAGIMRMALAHAIHHARHRSVFQKRLADQPMMGAVLAEMALDVEAATALVMRLARSFDLARNDPQEAARARLLTPAIKYWVCKTAPSFIYEAMECLGGNGYVEESMLPRLYREAPVNAIWEGSGNVMCLDVLRALGSKDGAELALLRTIAAEAADVVGSQEADRLIKAASSSPEAEPKARQIVDDIVKLAAAESLRSGAPQVAALFAQIRRRQRSMYGTGGIATSDARAVLERALPAG